MRLVIQRVSQASVTVEGEIVGAIQQGFLVLVGLCHGDTNTEAKLLAEKLVNLRVFEDAEGKMNLSLREVGGAALLVSQFTLYANCQKGRRPSFQEAMAPSEARPLFDMFCDMVRKLEVSVETGVFGASMQVSLCNQGPVTILLDSAELLRGR